jgi:hypothetical protein
MVPAGTICDIMKDDGTMARVPDLIEFCRTHDLKMLTVAELIRYRMQNERYVHRVGEAMIETKHGEFRLIAYESEVDGGESHWRSFVVISAIHRIKSWWHARALLRKSSATDAIAAQRSRVAQAIAEEVGGWLPAPDIQGIFLENREQSFLRFHRGAVPTLPESERKTRDWLSAQILST